jgi:hypothetical protein
MEGRDRIEREEEEQRKMGQSWVKDAMDIDEDGSGDVSKESEDDEKTSRRSRYVLLNQVFLFVYISSYRLVAIWVSAHLHLMQKSLAP